MPLILRGSRTLKEMLNSPERIPEEFICRPLRLRRIRADSRLQNEKNREWTPMDANNEKQFAFIRVYSRFMSGKYAPFIAKRTGPQMDANQRELIFNEEVYQIV